MWKEREVSDPGQRKCWVATGGFEAEIVFPSYLELGQDIQVFIHPFRPDSDVSCLKMRDGLESNPSTLKGKSELHSTTPMTPGLWQVRTIL